MSFNRKNKKLSVAAQHPEEARLRNFLDERGGYYNSRAGTYTDEEGGGYDKDRITKSMMAQIKAEHPLVPATPKQPTKPK